MIANVRGLSVEPWAAGSPWGRLHTVRLSPSVAMKRRGLVQQGIANTSVVHSRTVSGRGQDFGDRIGPDCGGPERWSRSCVLHT